MLPYPPLTSLQHPNTIEHREKLYVLLADIPDMEIHMSSHSMRNCNMIPYTSAVTHQVATISIQLYRFSKLHQFLCYVVTVNARTFTHNDYIWRSHILGLMFQSRVSVLDFWPGPRVSWWRELSSGGSGSILYVRCLWPTSSSCIRTEHCSLELLPSRIGNLSILVHLRICEIATWTPVLHINIIRWTPVPRTLSRHT
jgi:hypothetical protein